MKNMPAKRHQSLRSDDGMICDACNDGGRVCEFCSRAVDECMCEEGPWPVRCRLCEGVEQ